MLRELEVLAVECHVEVAGFRVIYAILVPDNSQLEVISYNYFIEDLLGIACMCRFPLHRIQVLQVNHAVTRPYRSRFRQRCKIFLVEAVVGGGRHFQAVEWLYGSILYGRGDILNDGLSGRA